MHSLDLGNMPEVDQIFSELDSITPAQDSRAF